MHRLGALDQRIQLLGRHQAGVGGTVAGIGAEEN